jgi:hypothetical protein
MRARPRVGSPLLRARLPSVAERLCPAVDRLAVRLRFELASGGVATKVATDPRQTAPDGWVDATTESALVSGLRRPRQTQPAASST